MIILECPNRHQEMLLPDEERAVAASQRCVSCGAILVENTHPYGECREVYEGTEQNPHWKCRREPGALAYAVGGNL